MIHPYFCSTNPHQRNMNISTCEIACIQTTSYCSRLNQFWFSSFYLPWKSNVILVDTLPYSFLPVTSKDFLPTGPVYTPDNLPVDSSNDRPFVTAGVVEYSVNTVFPINRKGINGKPIKTTCSENLALSSVGYPRTKNQNQKLQLLPRVNEP